MDEEFLKQLADYFTPAELVDLLDIDALEFVHLLEEYIQDKEQELRDYLNYGD